MNYGLRIKDNEGNLVKITPLVSSIVASGVYTSPTELNGDDTYGIDIDLPGTAPIPYSNITVIAEVRSWYLGLYLFSINFTGYYAKDIYASSSYTYYNMENSTSVMTEWTAGSCAWNDVNEWDKLIATFPRVSWIPQLSSTGLFTSIRIFSGTINCIYDTSASSLVTPYFLYGVPSTNLGVKNFIVTVIISNWNY